MTKKPLNQNDKCIQELTDYIEPNFIFSTKPINRFKIIKKNNDNFSQNKADELHKLKKKIC